MGLKRVRVGRQVDRKDEGVELSDNERPRILYVEDNSTNWEITSLELRREYALEWARDSRAVYQKLKGEPFDLILMDIELSGSDLDGIEITRCLRGHQMENPPEYIQGTQPIETPILFLTAYTARYDAESLAYAGADGVLTKPVDFKQLQKSMVQVIHSHRKRANLAIQQVKDTERAASEKIEAEVARREVLEDSLEELEIRQAELNRRLEFAQEQLVHGEQLATFGSMIAGIAHELNSPTSAIEFSIAGLVEKHELIERAIMALFDDSPQAQELKSRFELMFREANESLNIMGVSSERMLEYCSALQTNARFDTSMVANVDLNKVVEQSLLIVRAKTKPYTIEFSPVPVHLLTCKRNHLGQVVINLLSNAADALAEKCVSNDMPAEGCIIKVSVQNEIRSKKEGVLVTVEDNGDGVKPELRTSIFESYFTTKQPGQGTGLGLAISYQIVTNHGGEMWVDDCPGLGGARFSVWLPRAL
jgi:signal transduction histidine kinase